MRRYALAVVIAAAFYTGGFQRTAGAEAKGSLLCESIEAAVAGYWIKDFARPDVAMKESTTLERQKSPSQWRIDFASSDRQALVTRYSGTFQQLESPKVWQVERDPGGAGLILLPGERTAGTSPEVITITLATLHFVYSSQHVNPLYNRANIWVGACRRAP